MSRTHTIVVVALVLSTALVPLGTVGSTHAQSVETASASRGTGTDATRGLYEDLTGTIEAIDEFLETVLDLVRTVNALFGGGETGD